MHQTQPGRALSTNDYTHMLKKLVFLDLAYEEVMPSGQSYVEMANLESYCSNVTAHIHCAYGS